MKGTRHNGRSGKNGVYNPLHNDRRFNTEHSEHIDNERVRQVKDVRARNCKLEKLVDMSCVEAVKAAEEKSKDAT